MTAPMPEQPLEQQPPELSYREQLVNSVLNAPPKPDIAGDVYRSVGINIPNVYIRGDQAQIADLQPGDLVGWHGSLQDDGTYTGNMAVYAGNGEILESPYGFPRRRKITEHDNVFGLPVTLQNNELDTQAQGDYTAGHG